MVLLIQKANFLKEQFILLIQECIFQIYRNIVAQVESYFVDTVIYFPMGIVCHVNTEI